MQTLATIKALLDERCLRPKRSLGQNFLIDHNLIRKLMDAADVRAGDLILEIGPGTGTLTEALVERGASVIACELDDQLAELNRTRIPSLLAAAHPSGAVPTFQLVHGDCLAGKHAINPEITSALAGRRFKLVANLPYGAATPLIMLLLMHHPECFTMAVTIQRELADRLLAKPGSKDFGPISVLCAATARASKIATAPPECFWPRPDVTSTLLLIERSATPLTPNLPALVLFTNIIFSQRRKQLGGVLPRELDWAAIACSSPVLREITPTLRAEQLSPQQIIALHAAVQPFLPKES